MMSKYEWLPVTKSHDVLKLQVQQPHGTQAHQQITPRRMVTTCTLKRPGLVNMATRLGWWAETSSKLFQAHNPANCGSSFTCTVTRQRSWMCTSGTSGMELPWRTSFTERVHRELFGTERWWRCLQRKTSRFNFVPFYHCLFLVRRIYPNITFMELLFSPTECYLSSIPCNDILFVINRKSYLTYLNSRLQKIKPNRL